MFFISLVCFCVTFYYLFTKNPKYWKSRRIPYEKSMPLFGNFYKLVTKKQSFHERVREIYNDNHHRPYLGIHVFTAPYIFLRDPNMIRIVLAEEFEHFTDRTIYTNEKLDPLWHNGLFAAKYEIWKYARKGLSPGFTPGKLKQMFFSIQRCGNKLKELVYKYNGKEMDFKYFTKYYAVDVITSCTFGIDSNCLDENENLFRDMVMRLTDIKSFNRAVVVLCHFFLPRMVDLFRLKFAHPEASKFFLEIFEHTMKNRREQGVQRNDLINLMQELCESGGNNFNDIKMAANAMAFLAAGTSTSSLTINYTLCELALNKDIQGRLWGEISKTKGESNETFSYDNIQEMKYLNMVVHETLRKYPLLPFLDRMARFDHEFPEEQLKVIKGDRICIPIAGLHHDPKYFPNPQKYNPERFSVENRQSIVPFSYLPFGEGPRRCLGEKLGFLTVKVALVSILKDFQIDISEKTEIPINIERTALFMEPKNMFLKMRNRNC